MFYLINCKFSSVSDTGFSKLQRVVLFLQATLESLTVYPRLWKFVPVCAVFVRLRLPVKSSLTSMLQNGESRGSYNCIKMSIDFKMHRNTSKQVSLFIRSRFR